MSKLPLKIHDRFIREVQENSPVRMGVNTKAWAFFGNDPGHKGKALLLNIAIFNTGQ